MAEEGKIAIVGAGRVGSTFAYTLALSGMVREIVLIDKESGHAEGEAMDISHAVASHAPVSIVSGGLADTAGAAVTVIAAGVAQKTGEKRPALLQRNIEELRGIVPEVVRANPDGMILVATNPVDATTFAALRLSGLPPSRVFGSGTVLDSARLRTALSVHYGIDARNIHAYVLGEHGDSEFVAWSTAAIANMPLGEYCRLAGMPYPVEREAVEEQVRNAAYEIIRRKGATNFAIATAMTRIIEAIVRDEASVLTVSALVDGHYGLHDVCLSLPAIMDRSGIRQVIPITLSEDEMSCLRRSAGAVAKMVAGAGIAGNFGERP